MTQNRHKGRPPIQHKVTSHLVREARNALYRHVAIPDNIQRPAWLDRPEGASRWIVFENGMLNLDAYLDGEDEYLFPHSPEFFSSVALSYDFDVNAKCPQWCRILSTNLEGDEERCNLLQEWCGYLVSGDTALQKFLLLEGDGRNGKSVFLAGVTAMLGRESVSTVSLEQFGNNFALARTVGKLANISGDLSEIDRAAEGVIKMFTGGETMMFDRKHKSQIQAVPTARLMFSTNVRPRIRDRSNGIWRRMLLVPFTRAVPNNEVVLGMDNPQWWIDLGEMPGILNWALEGLRRLRENRRFTHSQVSVQAISEYKSETNSARAFLVSNYHEAQDGFVVTANLYRAYHDWCGGHGNQPLSSGMFGKEICRVFSNARKDRQQHNGRRANGYRGITRIPR